MLLSSFIVGIAVGIWADAMRQPPHDSEIAERYYNLWRDQCNQHRKTRERMGKLAKQWRECAELNGEEYRHYAEGLAECADDVSEELG